MSVVILARGGARLRATETPPPVLGTIDDLAATAGDAQVSLSWTPAENATSHQPQYRAGASGSWSSFGSALGGSASGVVVTGLTNGTSYQFRIVAGDGSTTTTSNVASATPEGAGAVEPAFADGFESGDKSHSDNGFAWSSTITPTVAVSADHAYEGVYSLRFRFGPDGPGMDSTAEQRFTIAEDAASAPSEVWLEYMLRVPDNYYHRDSGNNKFLTLWAEEYSSNVDAQFYLSMEHGSQEADGETRLDIIAIHGDDPRFPDNSRFRGPTFISLADRGQWFQIRVHARLAEDGEIHVWKDGNPVVSVTDYNMVYAAGSRNYFRRGYLMGWSNSGFTDQTDFYIDSFKVWTEAPAWWTTPSGSP